MSTAPISLHRYDHEAQALLVLVGKSNTFRHIPLSVQQRADLLEALAEDLANQIRSSK